MSTIIRTPTRLVTLTLIDHTRGTDYSRDYIGNNTIPSDTIVRLNGDDDDAATWAMSDEDATWWERQVDAQRVADAALSALDSDVRQTVIDSLPDCELEDLPSEILAAIEAVAP